MNAAAMDWLRAPCAEPDIAAYREAENQQKQLTKPAGSLGRMEELAIQLAALQGSSSPQIKHVHISVFVGDHGIAVEGVSAFPQVVTTQMIKNFVQGGAAISVAAKEIGAELEVINLGTVHSTDLFDLVRNYALGNGTANFTVEAAMSEGQLVVALMAGRRAVERAFAKGMELFIGGEMGIANTSSATALACALLGVCPKEITGPGTGLDNAGLENKANLIQGALDLHKEFLTPPLQALRYLGGFEIAALAGAYIRCAQIGVPVLVDGFIASSAALVATKVCPDIRHWLLFSHVSAEPGHQVILQELNAKPLLDFGMRLGEGSGAAIALPILRMACRLHNEMATFSNANISGKQ